MDLSATNQDVISDHFDGNTIADVSNSHATQLAAILQQQPHAPLDGRELREKVVEVLSNTANGCLIELGYYPGITQKLKHLEAATVNWQTENVKLYDDNRRLLETVRALQEKLKLVSIPEVQKLDRIRQLELEVQAFREVAARHPPQEGFLKEFSRLKESYARAFNEVNRLTALLQSQSVAIPRPSSNVGATPVQSPYENNQPVPFQHLNSPAPQVSQVSQRQMHVPSAAWQGGQPHAMSKPIPGRLPQKHPLQLTQTASLKQRHVQGPATLNPQLRRASTVAHFPTRECPDIGNLQRSNPIGLGQQSLPDAMHSQYLPFHADQLRHTPDHTSLGFHSRGSGLIGPLTIITSNIQQAHSASNPSTPASAASFTSQSVLHPIPQKILPNLLPSPAPRLGSAPMALDSPMSTQLDTSHTMAFTDDQAFSASLNVPPIHPPFNALTPVHAEQDPTPMPVTNVNPSDIHMKPPNSIMYELHGMPLRELQMQSATTPDPAVTTVSPQDLHIQPSISRKRGTSYTSDETPWDEAPDKRPRYDSPNAEAVQCVATPQTPLTPGQTAFGPVSSETLDNTILDFSTEMSHGCLESESEGNLHDPNGLQIFHDWIEEVFEYGSDGARVCRLCLNRYQKNYISEPPTSFVNAPDEVLEAHCLAEHEEAWLRQAEAKTQVYPQSNTFIYIDLDL